MQEAVEGVAPVAVAVEDDELEAEVEVEVEAEAVEAEVVVIPHLRQWDQVLLKVEGDVEETICDPPHDFG